MEQHVERRGRGRARSPAASFRLCQNLNYAIRYARADRSWMNLFGVTRGYALGGQAKLL